MDKVKNWLQEFEEDQMLRINWMIPLTNKDAGSFLRDQIESMDLNDLERAFGKNKYIKGIYQDEDLTYLSEQLVESYFGAILFEVATPVMKGSSYSWGYTNIGVMIGQDMDDIIEKSFKWRDAKKTKKAKKP